MTDIEMAKLAALAEKARSFGSRDYMRSFRDAIDPEAILALIERVRIAELERDEARLPWLEKVASAAANLCRYYEKSVNVGPFSNNPRREALFWQALRSALAQGIGSGTGDKTSG